MKKFFLVFVFCFLSFSLFSLTLKELFPDFSEQELFALEKGESFSDTSNVRKYLPAFSMIYSSACAAELHDNSFSVAGLTFVPYPDSWKNLSEDERVLKAYNLLLEISKQKGLTYISRTAGYKERTLFEDSYTISDSSDKNSKIDDIQVSSVPVINSVYAYQKDNRFGGNVYRLDYMNRENEIFILVSNCSKLKFMGATCVEENKLSMYLDAFLTDEGIVVSSMAEVFDQKKEVKLVVYTVDLVGSFERRITSLSNWFKNQVTCN